MSVDVEQTRRAGRRTSPAQPPRWVQWIPTAVLVAAVVVKVVVSPNAARDAVTNLRPLALTVAVAVGWVVLWLVVLPRLVRNGWIRTGILLLVALGLSAALVVPSVRDEKVVERFPRATATTGVAGSAPPATNTAAPTRLGRAPLTGIDHDATGTATLYEQPDGSLVVGLEEIDVEPGPDYRVFVVPGVDRSDPGDDGVELDALKGNQGTQFYPVPADTPIEAGEWTVLVWCRAFAVPIANATPV